MNRQVNLTKRIRTASGLRYCAVVYSNNGRVRPDVVIVNGQEERHPEGSYNLEWREGTKRIRLAVGRDAQDAAARRDKKEAELNARNNGVAVVADAATGRTSLAGAVATFLEDMKLAGKKPTTLAVYATSLRYFQESCHKQFIEEIDRRDLLRFSTFLRDEKKQSARSAFNRFNVAVIFLKAMGVQGLLERGDRPKYNKNEVPKVYEQEELDALFAACDAEEKLWYSFFLMTGMREQEVMHCEWNDVNLARRTIVVSFKEEQYGFSPKNYCERVIPIPQKLADALAEWKAKSDTTCGLLFPTGNCRPHHDFLIRLYEVCKRANLPKERYWLHKFRSTFATRCLRTGHDLRTVQSWLGHTDLQSTMRYLAPDTGEAVHAKVDATW